MNEQLANQIRQCPNLPSLPTIAVQVLDLTQHNDVDIAEIARLISKDPALSGKILKTVNSSFYGRSQNVGTISHALVILGLQSVKTLVLGFSLVTTLTKDKPKGFKHLTYWKRSIYAATAARIIAAKIGVVQQEEAFLAALLQDIGMLVLDRVLGETYGKIHDEISSHADLPAAEVKAIKADHAKVGGWIAAQWKLPPLLSQPIQFHHAPEQVKDPAIQKLAELVWVSSLCADVYVDQAAAQPLTSVRQWFTTKHNLSEPDCDSVLEEIGRSTREVASLFEIKIGTATSFEDVLKKANETLVQITLQAQQSPAGASGASQQTSKAATLDAVTGLTTRSRFDQFLAEEFAAAVGEDKPIALVVMNVDNMKAVLDRHGPPSGDRVLKAIGKLLTTATRTTDLAARYGGEELALVLPGTTRATAAAVAESIRRAITARPIACEHGDLPVTVSLGVAALEAACPLKEPAHLIKAAELALYAAKHSGRNCVRVFSLKAPSMNSAA
ncbi:MAG TPA: HDOD domain-containing protein [Tepidisphaeraceae bacterium]|nr:HDOD domain-containing protein [Tepidisphaeraceae bacterium]